MKFRKKPVVVEAFQWFENNPSFEGMEADLNSPSRFSCNTPHGKLNISSGDWIIKGIGGEFYLCKPDVFEKTYEPMDKSFKCAECNNIIEHYRYYCEECFPSGSYWISRYSILPGIGTKVETDGVEGKKICSLSLNGECIEWRSISDRLIVSGIKCWRPFKEKHPDFCKLREGDFLVIEWEGSTIKSKAVGFFDGFDKEDGAIILREEKNMQALFDKNYTCKEMIKKIIRINLETKEFEEI